MTNKTASGTSPSTAIPTVRRRRQWLLATSALISVLLPVTAHADDGTWLANPGTNDFNTAANWSGAAVPNGIATFGTSTKTAINVTQNTTIHGMLFSAGASNYTFTNQASFFTIGGAIVVSGGNATLVNNVAANTLLFLAVGQSGTASIQNAGRLEYIDTSSAASATITNTGNIDFNGYSGAGDSTINSSGNVIFRDYSKGSEPSFGTGHSSITNSGYLTFADHSSAAQATITNTGSLIFTDFATAGEATISLLNTSVAQFAASSKAGTAQITNAGALNFYNSASADHATIFNNSGGFSFNDNSTAGNALIVTTNFLGFTGLATAGSSQITNSGLIYFRGTSDGGSASMRNSGTVSFQQSATAGSIYIVNTAAASKILIRDDASGGNAAIELQAGSLDISQLYGTGTTLGSLQGAGGTVLLGSKNLAVGGTNSSGTFAGVIADGGAGGGAGGSLTKEGDSALILTGVNTYTGATTVNNGSLVIDGSIATSAATTVNAGGTLAGAGIVGNTSINGGILHPGDLGAIGTLTVQGSLAFTTAATYLIQLSPATASTTNVTGAATLGGATVAAKFAGGTYVAKKYTVLTANGGINGAFGAVVNTNLPAGFATSLSYDATHAYLNLALAVPNFGSNLNQNQRNVAAALVNSFNTVGSVPLVVGKLTPAGLTQVSGETATGTQQATVNAMTQFTGLLLDPNGLNRGGFAAPASPALQYAEGRRRSPTEAFAAIPTGGDTNLISGRWSVWAAGFGGSQTTSGNAVLGSNDARNSAYGTAVGADYRAAPNTTLGFAMAGGGTSFNVAGAGNGRSDLFQIGGYLRHTQGPTFIAAALAYGWQDVTTNRTINVAGTDTLRGRFTSNAFSGRIEGGYRFDGSALGLTPYAAAAFTTLSLPSYAEQVTGGGNSFALNYASASPTATSTELGVRAERSFLLPDTALLTLRGRLAWAHDYNVTRNASASFQILPASGFVVAGARPAADSALTTASAEINWRGGWSALATFEGQFADVTQSYAGKGTIRYAW